MELQIRKLEKSDVSSVIEIMQKAFLEDPWKEEWSLLACQNRVEEILSIPQSLSYILLKDGFVIGALLGRFATYMEHKDFIMEEFFIDPKEQKKGLGTLLLNHLVKEVKSQNVAKLSLVTLRGSKIQTYYERQGFFESTFMTLMEREI